LDKYTEIADRAYLEFVDISDYIWKSPKLIEHETKSEITKLKTYFPDDENRRKLRWKFESNKLESVFPYLISSGNLSCVLSILETYLMILALELEKDINIQLSSFRGNGINRIFCFFRKLEGINLEKSSHYHQINAAIKIRNCLLHASGMLEWSKDAKELERIQSSGTYLSNEHRNRRKNSGGEFNELCIVNSGFGKKIQVNNSYPHILSSYARDFIISLCQSASELK